ncbi:MAG: branched-chain amino acid ABC transporter permease [Xanthobacteraceae bacterium]|jgi:branched-chain amino acid transport system permease protein
MSELLQFTFSGLTVGAIYALVALGFTLIFNTSQVINFAQGEFVMLGGMVTVFGAAAGIPLPLAALLAVVVAVLFGVALYRFAIAPARGASPVTLIIITIGASIMMRGIAAVVFDKNFHGFASPLGDAPLKIGGAAILPQSLLVFAGVAFIVAALSIFLKRTLTGKSMLATADNPLAARLVGIDTSRMIEISFAVSATIGAVGGILATPIALTSYSTGTFLALKGFVAAMLGGMGSPLGAVIGGLLLGLIEQLGAGYLSSQYKDAIAVVVLLLVLFIRPSGLFGKAGIERV